MGLFHHLANRPIRIKILALFLLVFILLVSVQVMLFNIMRQGFESSLQQRSQQVLSVTALNIDSQLQKVERLSYDAFVSDAAQNNLPLPAEGSREYHLALADLSNDLYRRLAGNNYVLSVNYLYPHSRRAGNENTTTVASAAAEEEDFAEPVYPLPTQAAIVPGTVYPYETNDPSAAEDAGEAENALWEGFVIGRSDLQKNTSEAFLRRLVDDASALSGRCLWRRGEDGTLLLARMIRKIKNFNFAELGVMVYSVDIDRLVRDLSRAKTDVRFDLCIMSPDGPAYLGHALPEEWKTLANIPEDGAQTLMIDGVCSYVSYLRSDYTGWAYLLVARFDDLYINSRVIETTALSILVLCALIASVLAIRVSRHITRPLEVLSQRMQSVSPNAPESPRPADPDCLDEAALLKWNFERMLERIDHLIQENYVKQIALKDAQYKMLQTQINPHFLYNTLDSIDWMAKADGDRGISSMVEALASLMRETINMQERNIPLREELQLLEYYLTIQRIRLQEQFLCRVDAPEETLDCLVPKFTLQPILENCIAHGYDPETQRVTVQVTIDLNENWLTLRVRDEGTGIPADILERTRQINPNFSHHGIGLKNIDERLNIIYGGQFFFGVEGPEGRKTTLVIRIPAQIEAPGADIEPPKDGRAAPQRRLPHGRKTAL